MKKKFFETKFGIALKSTGVGLLKGVSMPVGAAVDEVITNLSSPEGGEGKVDWPRLVGYAGGVVIFGILLIMLVKGFITIDELKQLWKIFN